jgi:LCP family protein required for cell wall assembly
MKRISDDTQKRLAVALTIFVLMVAAWRVGAAMPVLPTPKPVATLHAMQTAQAAATAAAIDAIAQGGAESQLLIPVVGTPEANPTPVPTALPRWQGAGRLNLLLLGIDQRPEQPADKTNTDTMIVMTLDPDTHHAGMMSVPRDLYVPLPGRSAGRINTAQAIGGPPYAMRAVQATLGITLQHYVRVNFNAVTTLVDLLGGIDVYVDQDIDDPTYPDMRFGFDPFVISRGWHHLDGATALKYARTRHGSNDIYRMRRQQQIIMALRDRALSTDALPRLLPNAPLILSTLSDSIATDLSLSEMVQLLWFAKDLPTENITRVIVDETAVQPWTTPTGGAVLVPVGNRLRQLAQQLYPPAQPAQSGWPADVRVAAAIANATATPIAR